MSHLHVPIYTSQCHKIELEIPQNSEAVDADTMETVSYWLNLAYTLRPLPSLNLFRTIFARFAFHAPLFQQRTFNVAMKITLRHSRITNSDANDANVTSDDAKTHGNNPNAFYSAYLSNVAKKHRKRIPPKLSGQFRKQPEKKTRQRIAFVHSADDTLRHCLVGKHQPTDMGHRRALISTGMLCVTYCMHCTRLRFLSYMSHDKRPVYRVAQK